MVSLQINGNASKGARFYVLLLHLVIFCFFRHVPGLPAPARLKRPIPSTKGIEKLLFWAAKGTSPDKYICVVLI